MHLKYQKIEILSNPVYLINCKETNDASQKTINAVNDEHFLVLSDNDSQTNCLDI